MGTARRKEHRGALGVTRPTCETNERLPALMEPDVILPVQFFTRLQRGTAWTGEQRLMAALLEDALTMCSKLALPTTAQRSHLQRETMHWLRSNDRTWVFSFLRVCETLDLDPGAIRRGVRLRRAAACSPFGHAGVARPGGAPQGGTTHPAEVG